ncbi:hypothetical protein ACFE04_017337 [Oxalis oulophora]
MLNLLADTCRLKYWQELVQQVIKALERLLPQPVELPLRVFHFLLTNVRPAPPALNNNVTNVRPVSNIINLHAKQGQISQSQLPKTTLNTQFKKHIITNKSTSPSQMSDSQPPKTTPNT